MGNRKGAVAKILHDVYAALCNGQSDEVKKRILRVQISLKTGLNLKSYTPDSNDSEEDIKKILTVIRGPEIGLKDYRYEL
ncbi:MAG: hypothetical protein JW822_05030 [Spirochaetales bacterium]|nr:hypothetical protein [Spirochaetales bacterium]